MKDVKKLKLAYIGGGSRGWAWNLMKDLSLEPDIGGEVLLYDIDQEAARRNEKIGNGIREYCPEADHWTYRAVPTLGDALTGADLVIISILPGTFDEMESDVHAPEKYGIYQSVGDTSGPGGVIRALRTIPMFEEIARAIQTYSPDAWVINYTNPMTVCVRTLYRVFPGIKAFGCCHEVFGTQKLLCKVADEMLGIKDIDRRDIRVNVLGINHFTWLTAASYRGIDLMPAYRTFAEKYVKTGYGEQADDNWINKMFLCREQVKMDLFLRYGAIAAAGDRHLAEFCPGKWYLKDPETVEKWGFGLTPVSYRKTDLKTRLEQSDKLLAGEEKLDVKPSGEEGVRQIKAIVGLEELVTNVNLPNRGQIPNVPLGAVVETNACFQSDQVSPAFAGNIPDGVMTLMAQTIYNQECIVEAGLTRDLNLAFSAFAKDPLVTCSLDEAKELYRTMLKNTSAYLKDYDLSSFRG